ncbi:helix-turn-helix transcriptional regulator [Steroidobacter sp. S1-65]|uniref:Helix-turn-helix transcriptional regulator n=1 Tax=Steroidobacter gossypii TaxID=2805490 RepID=A0ABS1X0H8_9GAMM|nr:helix-turn-helix transcriptional regulator [Steroidobacter gossypii]MBM0106708.1 helix-turn-helix transcriptional regulator [Steroidobacter gossypii]
MFTDLRDGSARHSVQQPSSAEREVIVRVTPTLPAAVRAQMAAEAAAVLTGAMEALSLAAFVCDGAGSVLSLTPTAEALVRTDAALCLKSVRLCTDNPAETQALDDAIAAAAFADNGVANPRRRMIVVRGGRIEASPLVLEVVSLPRREFETEFAPRVLVIVRGTRVPNERRAAVVQAAYGLTAAETQIAMQVGAGETPQAIASARGVAVGTVRSQIKTICAKLGVSRQAELVARLNDL